MKKCRFILVCVLLGWSVLLCAESNNNDCYWYTNYTFAEFNTDGDVNTSSIRTIRPKNSKLFEIRFDYKKDYQTNEFPFVIWLNEIDDNNKIINSEEIGIANRSNYGTKIAYKENSIDIYMFLYHINISSEGKIIIYKTENGKYKSARMFSPNNDAIKALYGTRYDVLLGKMKNIDWEEQNSIDKNDFSAIELFCRQKLFFTYGGYAAGDLFIVPIDNDIADEVIHLLRHGANSGDANCQFMLACVLSGNKTIRAIDTGNDYTEVEIETPKDYKYLNDEEAMKYFELYLDNPKMNEEFGAFGYSFDQIELLINNAYPDFMVEYRLKRKRRILENIKKAASEPIKNTAPKFGLG